MRPPLPPWSQARRWLGLLVALGSSCVVGCERTTFSKTLGPEVAGPIGAAGAAGAPTLPAGGASGATAAPRSWAAPVGATRAAMLASVAACSTKKLRAAEALARDLSSAAAADAASPSTADSKLAVRVAWAKLMNEWQRLEHFQIGPLADGDQPGGKDGRVYVYAWPQLNRCVVDQVLVSRAYETDAYAGLLIGARGLGALEYLAFHEGADNGCAATSAINTGGAWAAIVGDLPARRAGYARAIAVDVEQRIRALGDAWDPSLGNFSAELVNPGKVYADQPMAFNAVGAAMFYLDKQVKDLKLGRPLGLYGCTTGKCPEALESPWAGRAKEHVRANLHGFGELYHGCDDGVGVGMEDVLVGVGAVELAERVRAHLELAFVSVDALGDASLATALVTDEARLAAVHGAVRQVAIDLRSEIVTVLDLEVPAAAEGDND